MNIILIDNFDSFTYNLVDLLRSENNQVTVFRNNISLDKLDQFINKAESTPLLVLSPGPGTPSSAGNLLKIIDKYKGITPMIGICLGHQAIVESYGGKVVKAPSVIHGKSSSMITSNHKIFESLSKVEQIGRYHSLMGSEIPKCIHVISEVEDIPMIIEHKEDKILGFQFHPESILTRNGAKMLTNSLNILKG